MNFVVKINQFCQSNFQITRLIEKNKSFWRFLIDFYSIDLWEIQKSTKRAIIKWSDKKLNFVKYLEIFQYPKILIPNLSLATKFEETILIKLWKLFRIVSFLGPYCKTDVLIQIVSFLGNDHNNSCIYRFTKILVTQSKK